MTFGEITNQKQKLTRAWKLASYKVSIDISNQKP